MELTLALLPNLNKVSNRNMKKRRGDHKITFIFPKLLNGDFRVSSQYSPGLCLSLSAESENDK